MPDAEREIWITLFSDVLVKTWFALKLWDLASAGALSGDAGLILWGKTVLWMIPISIVVQIALTILFAIGRGILTNGKHLPTVKDERDRMIAARGMITSYIVASLGTLAGIAAIATGQGALIGLTLILAGIMAADVVGNLVKLGHYRLAG